MALTNCIHRRMAIRRKRQRPVWSFQSMVVLVCSVNCLSFLGCLVLAQVESNITTTPPISDNNATTLLLNATSNPTEMVSSSPTQLPSASALPTASVAPSYIPSLAPSDQPTESIKPSTSAMPTSSSSPTTSMYPSMSPTKSMRPSTSPSVLPSMDPTDSSRPSFLPSVSLVPTHSSQPSILPSITPTDLPSMRPSHSSLPSIVPSISPTSAPTRTRETIYETDLIMTLRGLNIEWNETHISTWENVTTTHILNFYSDYLEALGDKQELAPAEVTKVNTTYTDKEHNPSVNDDGTTVVEIHYNQSIRHTLQSPYDDFDDRNLFIIPFEFDPQAYLIELMAAFDSDEEIFLVGGIRLHNVSKATYWTPGKNDPNNNSDGKGSRKAIPSLVTVGVLSVLLIGAALILNIHKRDEQNRQNLIFEEELQYQQQNQQELQEQEQGQQEQPMQQQGVTGTSPATPSRVATYGTVETVTSIDTVGIRTASLHSSTNAFGSGPLGTASGHDGVTLTSTSGHAAAVATPPPTQRTSDARATSVGASSSFIPISSVNRSRSAGAQSDLTESEYYNSMVGSPDLQPSPIDRHHSSGVASDRMSEITASEYDPSIIATDDLDGPSSRLQRPPEIPEGEGSFPLSPVHIPDEEFEANSDHRDDDATDDSGSIGLPDDHQPGVLGLHVHNEMPSMSGFNMDVEELE